MAGHTEPRVGRRGFCLDIGRAAERFGPPAQLQRAARGTGCGGVSRGDCSGDANFDTARMKAAAMRGIAVIAEGRRRSAGLSRCEGGAADCGIGTRMNEYAATFALWGIGTLGELAATAGGGTGGADGAAGARVAGAGAR